MQRSPRLRSENNAKCGKRSAGMRSTSNNFQFVACLSPRLACVCIGTRTARQLCVWSRRIHASTTGSLNRLSFRIFARLLLVRLVSKSSGDPASTFAVGLAPSSGRHVTVHERAFNNAIAFRRSRCDIGKDTIVNLGVAVNII
jgi:hypothetical protein